MANVKAIAIYSGDKKVLKTGDTLVDSNGDIVNVSDAPYGVGWNGDLLAPSKNAIYDKLESILNQPTTISFTSGEALTNGNPVGIDAYGKVKKAFNLWLGAETSGVNSVSYVVCEKVTTDKFFLVYTVGSETRAVIASTVEDGTVSLGTSVQVFAAAGFFNNIAIVSATKVVVSSGLNGTGYVTKTVDISGTTLTANGQQTIFADAAISGSLMMHRMIALSATVFVFGYAKNGSNTIFAKTATLATDTFTFDTEGNLYGNSGGTSPDYKLKKLNSTYFILTAANNSSGTDTTFVAPVVYNNPGFTVGTAYNIHASQAVDAITEIILNPANANQALLISLIPSSGVISFGTWANSNAVSAVGSTFNIGTINGNGTTFSANDNFFRYLFGDYFSLVTRTGVSYIKIRKFFGTDAALSNVYFVSNHKPFTNSHNLVSSVVDTYGRLFIFTANSSGNARSFVAEFITSFIGIAQATVARDVAVLVLAKGEDDAQSGLTPGNRYFAKDGAVSSDQDYGSDAFIGIGGTTTSKLFVK